MGWILLLSSRTFGVTLTIRLSQNFLCTNLLLMLPITGYCPPSLFSLPSRSFFFQLSVFPYLAPSPSPQLVVSGDSDPQGSGCCLFRYGAVGFRPAGVSSLPCWRSASCCAAPAFSLAVLGKLLNVRFIMVAACTYTFIFHISDLSSPCRSVFVSEKTFRAPPY